MKTTSPKLDTAFLTANDEALLRCEAALELRDKSDYEGVREIMRPIWKRVGDPPDVKGFDPPVVAEVLMCVGLLTSWMGSQEGIEDEQEVAKNLIGEAITFYEAVGDVKKVAEARAEIARCYLRQGALNEARILLTEALQKLTTEGNTRARTLLRLAIVECSASRYDDASKILADSAHLFSKISNHAIIGAYHNQIAMVLRKLARPENRDSQLQRAIREYRKADAHFKLAHNIVFRANVKNNVGFMLYKMSRYKEAHRYLEEARRLAVRIKNKIQAAEIDDTRAQVFIAEGKFKQAAMVASHAVRVLGRSGHQCLLADSLITHGIALARLGKRDQAQFTFQRAIEVAHQVGALNKAGLAALTLIEEIEELTPEYADQIYDRATEWLAKSQSEELWLRVIAASKKIRMNIRGELSPEDTTEAVLRRSCDLQTEVLKFEGRLIQQALAKVDGRLTQAASLLGMGYQALAYIIEGRHKELLKERSPVHRRSRKKKCKVSEYPKTDLGENSG